MGQFTIFSATYYSQFTIGGIPSGWNRQAESLNNPIYGASTYEEQGGPIDNEVEQGEIINPDYSGSDATFLGKVIFGGREFYFIQDEFGFLLGSPEVSLAYANFPVGITPTDVLDENMGACFLTGTLIDTPEGCVAVELLGTGDTITTAKGASTRVLWVGHRTMSTRFGAADRFRPVRIEAGAFGDALPKRDLLVTADHALLLDGCLINAGALINGQSIRWEPMSDLGERYTVYHIETEAHEVILAEGTHSETYIDYVARRAFDNYAEYRAQYGEDRTISESMYPRISSARHLPDRVKRRLQSVRRA